MFNVNMFKNVFDFNWYLFTGIVVGFTLKITWEDQFH